MTELLTLLRRHRLSADRHRAHTLSFCGHTESGSLGCLATRMNLLQSMSLAGRKVFCFGLDEQFQNEVASGSTKLLLAKKAWEKFCSELELITQQKYSFL